jgi:hypothetical protein
VGLEQGLLSLVSTTGELPGRNSSGSGLETMITAVRIRCADLYSQKLTLTSPTSSGSSVAIVHSQTKATEFSLVLTQCLR